MGFCILHSLLKLLLEKELLHLLCIVCPLTKLRLLLGNLAKSLNELLRRVLHLHLLRESAIHHRVGLTSTCSFESNKTGSRSSKLSLSRSKRYETSRWPSVVRRHLPRFAPILVGGLVISPLEKWGFVDAIYYSVVTSKVSAHGSSMYLSILRNGKTLTVVNMIDNRIW